jgi:hypothetical protein
MLVLLLPEDNYHNQYHIFCFILKYNIFHFEKQLVKYYSKLYRNDNEQPFQDLQCNLFKVVLHTYDQV